MRKTYQDCKKCGKPLQRMYSRIPGHKTKWLRTEYFYCVFCDKVFRFQMKEIGGS